MSKVILQLASQIFLVATNDECERPGTMWASVMAAGSHGISRLHVWVDFIIEPSGKLIQSGEFVGRLFLTVVPLTIKCAVAPESKMAYSGGFSTLLVFSSSEDRSSSVRSVVVAVALLHSCLCKQLEVTTVLSSPSLLVLLVLPIRIL